jgi:hypothetical protein
MLGSGGFWAWLQKRERRKSGTVQLLMGVAYREITTLGIQYIDRGSITMDEYKDLRKFFYDPYRSLGGNGVAERIMNEVEMLPIRSHEEHSEIFKNPERVISNVRVFSRSSS